MPYFINTLLSDSIKKNYENYVVNHAHARLLRIERDFLKRLPPFIRFGIAFTIRLLRSYINFANKIIFLLTKYLHLICLVINLSVHYKSVG